MKKIVWEKWSDFNQDDYNNHKIVISTPIGMVSHKISATSNGELNFWVGNTNFDIDPAHFTIIKNSPGVETLNVWTPYKFRICIGKAFNTNKVLKNIEVAVGCVNRSKSVNLTPEQKFEISNVKKDISKNKFWAIYILPNGKYEYCGTNNNAEFLETYSFFNNMEHSIGGKLLSPMRDQVVY